ncbi:hypothetical protein TrST_g7136 [Triparma strigata]|uniref:Methyltransferase domain-containing protein n=1 Tax=Triparma strigata TaxID=1606541 RepID=A0A9W7EMT9_9STRA|nr:hypothetical protein TrST_g7136 [Triparma strigata]
MNFIIRDFEEEALFLTEIYGDYAQNQSDEMKIKVLEFGSGPGRHITTGFNLSILAPGSVGVDSNPLMVSYARRLSPPSQPSESFELGDMCDYDGKGTFDACWVLLNTLAHVSTLAGFLESVERSLRPGGVAVVEMFSPEDVERFKAKEKEPDDWIVEFDGGEYIDLTKSKEIEGHELKVDDVVILSSRYGPEGADAFDEATSMLGIDLEVKVTVIDKLGEVKVDRVFGEGAGKMRVVEVDELAKEAKRVGLELIRDANDGLGGWRELSWENDEGFEDEEEVEGVEEEAPTESEEDFEDDFEEDLVNDDRWICVLRKKLKN